MAKNPNDNWVRDADYESNPGFARMLDLHEGMKPRGLSNDHLSDLDRAHSGQPGSKVRHGADATGMAMAKRVYVDHHPDDSEYKVHLGGRNSRGSYHTDREDAVGTARAEYGRDAVLIHRSRRYGPEPD